MFELPVAAASNHQFPTVTLKQADYLSHFHEQTLSHLWTKYPVRYPPAAQAQSVPLTGFPGHTTGAGGRQVTRPRSPHADSPRYARDFPVMYQVVCQWLKSR